MPHDHDSPPVFLPATDATEEQVALLVRRFYDAARADALLGPVFEAHVADWPHHFELLQDFWSHLLRRTGRYQGRPLPKHVELPVDAKHFARWLELFSVTARDVLDPQAAEFAIDRARRIADTFRTAIDSRRG
ncbi:group III truncated hemoglobin [Derxia gummosa]|uniref:Group III truncated hemoglobin n=1 Tax=Derxia gummosa DSM 723 TaxID=1121388 RepID=A0A8B6X999_9BURK|nr:group III truncated hemoglobin [Derxia gummosa]